MNVGETPIRIGSASYLIQNLGPDNLYVGDEDVTDENGLQLAAGESVARGVTNAATYVVSSGTSDARILGRGTGFFSPATAPADPEP